MTMADISDDLAQHIEQMRERGPRHLIGLSDEELARHLETVDAEELRQQELDRCRELAETDIPKHFRRTVTLNGRVQLALDQWLDQFWTGEGRDDEWEAGRTGLCLVGRPGAGKTQAAWQLIRRLLERGFSDYAFHNVQSLFDELTHRSQNKRSDSDLIQRLASIDLLVLDDLGAKPLTEFREERLLRILDARYLADRSTIVTTNVAATKFSEHFGGRNQSRIGGMCRVVLFPNVDWRTGIDYSKEAK